MHIMEGFLPVKHAIGWTVVSAPFVAYGLHTIDKRIKEKPEQRMLLGVAAAFTFVLSALKMPSVTGSCSHPTGTGLGAILFGPAAMAPIGAVVLLFQAILLAHGGLTTLGANIFSMAIVGPFAAAAIYLLTYVTTSAQLALAFPDPAGGFAVSFAKFATVFAITQLPLAISEGLLTIVVFNALVRFNPQELQEMKVVTAREVQG